MPTDAKNIEVVQCIQPFGKMAAKQNSRSDIRDATKSAEKIHNDVVATQP